MRLLLNIIWFVLAGFWMAILYYIAGLLIITLPFGLQAFRIAGFALWPFGRTLVKKQSAGAASGLGNLLWNILFGWWLALGHLLTAALQALTIVGLPLAATNIKLIPISLTPLGREVVPASAVAAATGDYSDAVSVELSGPTRSNTTP